MRIRKTGSGLGDKIELQMTPMIDVVFQLLIFFMFTFKIATQEGDFNVKMPIAGGAAMNAETLAAALGGRRAGKTWMACCPAHDRPRGWCRW